MRYLSGLIIGFLIALVVWGIVGFGFGLLEYRPLAAAERDRQIEEIRNQAREETRAARRLAHPVAEAWIEAMADRDGEAMWSMMDPSLQQRYNRQSFVASIKRGEGDDVQIKPVYVGRYDSPRGAALNFFVMEYLNRNGFQRATPFVLRVANDKVVSVE